MLLPQPSSRPGDPQSPSTVRRTSLLPQAAPASSLGAITRLQCADLPRGAEAVDADQMAPSPWSCVGTSPSIITIVPHLRRRQLAQTCGPKRTRVASRKQRQRRGRTRPVLGSESFSLRRDRRGRLSDHRMSPPFIMLGASLTHVVARMPCVAAKPVRTELGDDSVSNQGWC